MMRHCAVILFYCFGKFCEKIQPYISVCPKDIWHFLFSKLVNNGYPHTRLGLLSLNVCAHTHNVFARQKPVSPTHFKPAKATL